MSYIRATCRRRFSKGTCGLYVYLSIPDKKGRQYLDGFGNENPEDVIEIMFRILERSGIEVTLDMVNAVRIELCLKPLKSIVSLEEYNKDFECPECRICRGFSSCRRRKKKNVK